jgi:hypothetical protein
VAKGFPDGPIFRGFACPNCQLPDANCAGMITGEFAYKSRVRPGHLLPAHNDRITGQIMSGLFVSEQGIVSNGH